MPWSFVFAFAHFAQLIRDQRKQPFKKVGDHNILHNYPGRQYLQWNNICRLLYYGRNQVFGKVWQVARLIPYQSLSSVGAFRATWEWLQSQCTLFYTWPNCYKFFVIANDFHLLLTKKLSKFRENLISSFIYDQKCQFWKHFGQSFVSVGK